MYSKDEAAKLKEAFWTAFGQYIALHPSAEGQKINWINYRTGIKHLSFKLYADSHAAFIAIELSQPDPGIQQLVFEQFLAFKSILKNYLNEDWDWDLHTTDAYGKTVSRIGKALDHVSIFRQADWPAMISFFKPRIIALDEFWTDAQHSFDLFR